MKKLLLLIPILAALAACGDSGNGDDGAAGGTMPAAAAPASDAFIDKVSSTIGTTSDSAEPVAIDSVSASSPEDSEPSPVS